MNDSIILAADELEFRWSSARTMRGYLIGIAADNLGTVQLTESMAPVSIRHRPAKGRPFRWPLGHDGFVFYQRTGGLPDIVKYALVVVRDRWSARRIGQVLQEVASDDAFGSLAQAAAYEVAGSVVANVALGVLAPALEIVGRVLASSGDKVLDTVSGGIHLESADKRKSEIVDVVSGAIVQAHLDFHLFDAAVDGDSAAHLSASVEAGRRLGVLVTT